jgi:hypothetical protein
MTDIAHKEFPQPEDPTVLAWRYVDLPKLLSLLLTKKLHLTRLDALEDKLKAPFHYRPNRRCLQSFALR